MDLANLCETYLDAEGYDVIRRGKNLLRGQKQGIAEAMDYIFVWVPPEKEMSNFRSLERSYLTQFEEIDRRYPTAQKFMLVQSRQGLSREFTQGASRWHDVKIRVPIQFFDTSFKWDESDAPSAANELRKRGRTRMIYRVPQPFRELNGDEKGNDLLEALFRKLRARKNPKSVHVIAGPAGIGKTYLYESLFARLYDSFVEDKKNQRNLWLRPLPLLPEYLESSNGSNLEALLDAFLQTEFARPLTRQVFEWMLANQFGIWLIDGLDEIISRDPNFFEYILDLMTKPGIKHMPSIVVCVRDSLLVTNTGLSKFCEEYADSVQLHELTKWGAASKRKFAATTLGDDADEFLAALRERAPLNELASTPYYSSLLADQFREGRLKEHYSESELIEDALSNIVQRDYGKGFLDPSKMPESNVREFAEGLVYEDLRNGFQGIPVDVVRSSAEEWADLFWDSDEVDGERQRFVSQITQLGLFSQGNYGYIQFSQEILKHYLWGRRLVRLFEQDQSSWFLRDITKQLIPVHWITLKILAEHISTNQEFEKILAMLPSISDPIAFKNAVQLACLAASCPGALKHAPLERKDLAGVVFRDLDLSNVSFRECDLSNVEFLNCALRSSDFSGAIIKNTLFALPGDDSLVDAEVGDLLRFHSMKVGRGTPISDHAGATRWFNDQTKRQLHTISPCSAALQLRHVFGKFVHSNGTPRRDVLDEKGMLAGKRYYNPKKVLEAAVKYGYMISDRTKPKAQHAVRRPEGERYSELVEYVKGLTLTSDIRSLLSDTCKRRHCEHIPQLQ